MHSLLRIGLIATRYAGGSVTVVYVCVCVIFFYDDKDMHGHSYHFELVAAAPEFSFPLGDKPVSQPALFQTLVGHSVIVVRQCTVLQSCQEFI